MTTKEAIKEAIKEAQASIYDGGALELIINALEKQIPKKPLLINYEKNVDDLRECPSCHCSFHKREGAVGIWFCPQCSQRLDWGDTK